MKKRKNKILYKILMPIMLLVTLFMVNGVYAIETEKTVTFEVLTWVDDNGTGNGTVTNGTYNNILQYALTDQDDLITNITNLKINDVVVEFANISLKVNSSEVEFDIDSEDYGVFLLINDTISGAYDEMSTNIQWIITFLVDIEPQGTIIDVLSDWVGGFTILIISVVQSMTPIFWLEGTGLTLVGMLSLMAVGIGLIYLGLRFILQLFPGSHQL